MNIENSSNTIDYKELANKSFKWTTLAEIFAKVATPLTNMVLARLILPDVFGIVASVNIVIALSDIFSEGGFGRFLIQKDFESHNELCKTAECSMNARI